MCESLKENNNINNQQVVHDHRTGSIDHYQLKRSITQVRTSVVVTSSNQSRHVLRRRHRQPPFKQSSQQRMHARWLRNDRTEPVQTPDDEQTINDRANVITWFLLGYVRLCNRRSDGCLLSTLLTDSVVHNDQQHLPHWTSPATDQPVTDHQTTGVAAAGCLHVVVSTA